MRLDGQVAIVTGAGSGIGRATAELFGREGALLVLGDVNTANLEEVAVAIKAAGGKAVTLKANIADRNEAEALTDFAVSTYGRLDILVNNAGIMDFIHPVGTVEDDVWDRIISVNLTGTMYVTRRAVQVMLGQGSGSIVNMSSRAGLFGGSGGVAYTTSKHGVIGLTRSTAWQYAQKGIRCNAICPGGVTTPIFSPDHVSKQDPEGADRFTVTLPLMPAMLDPIDIAYVALFLASAQARHINGAVINADAGWTTA